jgi:hypothetical protein
MHYHSQDIRTGKFVIRICVENDASHQKYNPGMDEFKLDVFDVNYKFSQCQIPLLNLNIASSLNFHTEADLV